MTYPSNSKHSSPTFGNGRTRVVAQVGHCSEAVGAGEIAHALGTALAERSDAYLVAAGCDGACFAAPQVVVTYPSGAQHRHTRVTLDDVQALVQSLDNAKPQSTTESDVEAFFDAQHRRLLSCCGSIDPGSIGEYVAIGGYGSLALALSVSPEEVIQTVQDAGLLGRGGAYFPAARKWQGARSFNAPVRYLVVNAEEGEPGVFKDRHIMEGDPHLLLEGMLIAAYASGTSQAYVYVNAEANLSAERMEGAIKQAQEAGYIGDDILSSGFELQVSLRRGAGGYVCGEETTLLDTIQGNRREPRLRPPFPVESGLFRMPTVINNVETLANVPLIFSDGAAPPTTPDGNGNGERPFRQQLTPFTELGLEAAKGTKMVCLSGAVRRPGLGEVPMGTTIRDIVYGMGGGPRPGHNLGVIGVGGPSSGVLPPSELDTPLRPGMLHPSGVVMGAGGIMVMDDQVPVIDVVRRLAAYNAAESCGKCTPCREGTPRIVQALDRVAEDGARAETIDELHYLAEIVGAGSLCGLGQMAGGPVNSALHFFGNALEV